MSDEIKKSFFSKASDETKAFIKKLQEEYKVFKAEMSELNAAAAAPPAATDAPSNEGELADGTKIKYSGDAMISVGADVVIVTDAGETPAPDGELTMKDGTIVTVMGGKVSEVATPDAEQEGMKAEAKQVSERVTKIVEKFEAQFAAQEAEIKKLKIQLDNQRLLIGKQGKKLVETFEAFQMFGEIPTEEPIEKPENKKTDKISKLIEMTKPITKK